MLALLRELSESEVVRDQAIKERWAGSNRRCISVRLYFIRLGCFAACFTLLECCHTLSFVRWARSSGVPPDHYVRADQAPLVRSDVARYKLKRHIATLTRWNTGGKFDAALTDGREQSCLSLAVIQML